MSDSIVSSRTPEGSPNRCPICQAEVRLEPSAFFGDAPCPNCGQLLWFANTGSGPLYWDYHAAAPLRERLRRLIAEQLGVEPEEVDLQADFVNELGADSLDAAELAMELEEEFGIDLSDFDLP